MSQHVAAVGERGAGIGLPVDAREEAAGKGQADAGGPADADAPKAPTLASSQSSFSYNLRGHSINPMIDASTPLIALILRINTLSNFKDIDNLHKNCVNEIEAIELELQRLGYDRVAITAHRYCLCSAVDEAIMRPNWGKDSVWSEKSLLTLFHNETHAGEKFFSILKRVMLEPARYLHLIEFQYLLLCLGYEGRHQTLHAGRTELEALIKEAHDVIRKTKGQPEPLKFAHLENVITREHHVKWQTPITLVLGVTLLVMGAIYAGFFYATKKQVDLDLQKIETVLKLK